MRGSDATSERRCGSRKPGSGEHGTASKGRSQRQATPPATSADQRLAHACKHAEGRPHYAFRQPVPGGRPRPCGRPCPVPRLDHWSAPQWWRQAADKATAGTQKTRHSAGAADPAWQEFGLLVPATDGRWLRHLPCRAPARIGQPLISVSRRHPERIGPSSQSPAQAAQDAQQKQRR